ncbi:next to BRCA1 gene 1 protein isoform X2 [Anabrus simplex]|uniref:next to BRCA1 gene 1 protein isoform X2 n=1 Tax=Anabrus simplex TaxID=316456 RepID=UPI0035A2814F
MSNEMESAGIRFEVQWKKKTGVVGRREDVTSIGLWDPEDSTLDWKTFKTYLCQNIGTTDDISVAYVDSEGDELPIESECEFQEALKFARERARKGRETLLKVDRQGSTTLTPPTSKSSENMLSRPLMLRCDKSKHAKLNNKSLHKVSAVTDVRVGSEERKSKLKKHASCGDHQMAEEEQLHIEKMDLVSKLMEDLGTKTDNSLTDGSHSFIDLETDVAPQWFKKYMQKLKTEMVTEVTARVLHGMQQMLERQAGCYSSLDRNNAAWPTTKNKKKKRVSDEDSSDGTLGSDSRDHKLLKKIEKLHKREKKLEKKLDSKLEKLENKTKRMMEKKSQSKARCERVPERKVTLVSRKKSNDVLTGTYLMDAILLNDSPKTEIHIQPGERFTKIWEIMNTGTLPWTDKTELRQAWGTVSLEPDETVVKCPILEPGEKGLIAVNFRAPEYPGTFESYWHFYHMGDRFGHWIGCAVVVDSKEEKQDKKDDVPNQETSEENKCRTEHPVDLTVKSKPEQETNSCSECEANIALKAAECKREQTICKTKDPEYESDSDSDNLSVISGTVSLSSDSELDPNFVVVQMPACFLCDVPLGTVDTVPVVMKESKRKALNGEQHSIRIKSSDDMIELLNENEQRAADELLYNYYERKAKKSVNEQPTQRTVTVTKSNDMLIKFSNDNVAHEPEVYIQTEVSESNSPQGRVFAVDMEGHCRVEAPQPEAVEFCNFSSEKVYAVDMAGHCMPIEPQHFGANGSSVRSRDSETNGQSVSSCATSSSSSASYSASGSSCSATPQQHTKNNTSNTQTSQAQQSPTSTHDPLSNVIHILPETLVSGAVNVATSAFSTARAVISNLRSKQPGEYGDWNWNASGSSDFSTPTDRSSTESLKLLVEMGFTNKILNVLLLQRYDNDVAKVVAELLTYEEHCANGKAKDM